MIRVVCEGSTDFAVLDVVVRAVLKDSEPIVTVVQPNFDALRARLPDAPGPGWQGVRAYLQRPAAAAVAMLSDVFVVHVDADLRHTNAIEKKLREPGPDEHALDPLCEHVKSWFINDVPAGVIVVLPREATDAWVLAAHGRLTDVEADPAPASTLMVKGLLEARGSDPNKKAAAYAELAQPLADLIADKKQLARVPELARFVDKLRSRAHALRRAKRAARSS